MEPLKFKMSPNVRLRMTLDREIDLDPERKVFTQELFTEYRNRHGEAVARQNGLIKSVIFTDASLAMIISGKSMKIPGLDIGLGDIPVAREVLIILSAVSFMFFCIGFINAQMYEAILQTLARRRSGAPSVDPEFLSAAYTFTELHLKASRQKMNIWGVDFFTPGIAFKLYYGTIANLMMVAFIGVLLLHLGLLLSALWPILELGFSSIAITSAAICMNLAGVAIFVGPGFQVSENTFPQDQVDQKLEVKG